MEQSFFSELRSLTEDLHNRTVHHKTVQGIGSGTLPEETFRYYIEQDFQYLRRYVQVLSLATASTLDLAAARRLAELVAATHSIEIDFLRDLYEQFGGDGSTLDDVSQSPTCTAYTSYLLSVAAERNLFLTLAAVLPCQWGYADIATTLNQAGLPDDKRYSSWIENLAGEEFGLHVDWAISYLDVLARDAGQAEKERAKEIFTMSALYELQFWEMAWNREAWTAPARAVQTV